MTRAGLPAQRPPTRNPLMRKIIDLLHSCPLPDAILELKVGGVRIGFFSEKRKPGGSHKIHLVGAHLYDGVETGRLRARSTVVIPSSGSTAITTAGVARRLGLSCLAVVPADTSTAKLKLLSAAGAATEAAADIDACRRRAAEIAAAPGYFLLDQFACAPTGAPGPSLAHLHFNAVKDDYGQTPDETIVTFGTGTTALAFRREVTSLGLPVRITDAAVEGGVSARFYRDADRSVQASVVHRIEGINAGFVPDSACPTAVDGSVSVKPVAAFAACLEMKALGLDCGPSSGLAIYGALVRATEQRAGALISVPVYDSSARYPDTLLNRAYLESLEPALSVYRRQIRIFIKSEIWIPSGYGERPEFGGAPPTTPTTPVIPTMWPG